jgi:hypothetical protein
MNVERKRPDLAPSGLLPTPREILAWLPLVAMLAPAYLTVDNLMEPWLRRLFHWRWLTDNATVLTWEAMTLAVFFSLHPPWGYFRRLFRNRP